MALQFLYMFMIPITMLLLVGSWVKLTADGTLTTFVSKLYLLYVCGAGISAILAVWGY
jgi:hypothetical protein